jgi:type IV pilus assembly protein PilY1
VIFGNGYGSSNNTTAGIYIILIDPSSGSPALYYLATPATSTTGANGIASPASADIDLDHITDYIYAGDLQGNVWRFDVTSTDPTKWGVTGAAPLFTTPAGAPITTGLAVSVLRQFILLDSGGLAVDTSKPARIIVNFGTGRQIPESLSAAAQYASGNQYLFGIWDWNFNTPTTGWNAISNVKVIALDARSAPATIVTSSLQVHKVTTVPQTAPAVSYRTITQEPVCWAAYDALDASGGCPNPGTQYGWYIQLPGTLEQILSNPVLSPDGELVVNTFIPAQNSPSSCKTADPSTGFSMAVMPGTGSADPGGMGVTVQSYFTVGTGHGNTSADAIQLNGTGVPGFLFSGQKADHNAEYLVTQTSKGAAAPLAVNRHTIVGGKRLNWVQRR